MRLIHTTEHQLQEFFDDQVPPYAILSHTWDMGEITYQDIVSRTQEGKPQWEKFSGACRKAHSDGYTWLWIDTCCIDKTSSAELSEAINSMYNWYMMADICYVYLTDFFLDLGAGSIETRLRRCRWFYRGWTLQELIAPPCVEFYDVEWKVIGTKLSLSAEISGITGISVGILSRLRNLTQCTVGYRLSWMAGRSTSRNEDKSYALLGIFNVNMPLLYGEGPEKAFRRLQEEILKKSEDHSIFLWTPLESSTGDTDRLPFLATYPDEFRRPSKLSADSNRIGQTFDYYSMHVLDDLAYRGVGQTLVSKGYRNPSLAERNLSSSRAGHMGLFVCLLSQVGLDFTAALLNVCTHDRKTGKTLYFVLHLRHNADGSGDIFSSRHRTVNHLDEANLGGPPTYRSILLKIDDIRFFKSWKQYENLALYSNLKLHDSHSHDEKGFVGAAVLHFGDHLPNVSLALAFYIITDPWIPTMTCSIHDGKETPSAYDVFKSFQGLVARGDQTRHHLRPYAKDRMEVECHNQRVLVTVQRRPLFDQQKGYLRQAWITVTAKTIDSNVVRVS